MKQRMLFFLSLVFLIAMLIGINAVSYKQKDKEPDSELTPNRSTYNTGATGTRAFYDLLAETGRSVIRWQKPPSALFTADTPPRTFVIIGSTRLEIDEAESAQILRWVSEGGNLVVIDREPPGELITTTANWSISVVPGKVPVFGTDPSDHLEMTAQTPAVKPFQASVLTRNINAVQPSRFASSVAIGFFGGVTGTTFNGEEPPADESNNEAQAPSPDAGQQTSTGSESPQTGSTPAPVHQSPTIKPLTVETIALNAPFIHVANNSRSILVDFPYGSGRIIYLTDPYIVTNGGIKLADNAQLAVNVVASSGGPIAFDEFHQGYGANTRTIFGYFEGTPVLSIFWQIVLLAGVVFWSQSRRFARAVPAFEPNRLSKLEYVSAMAELQQRTRAYDLAVENIYSQFRRSAARLFGMDNFTTSCRELAKAIAERVERGELEVHSLMRRCEEIIQGKPTDKREVLELIRGLREIEERLGLRRTRKQAFRK